MKSKKLKTAIAAFLLWGNQVNAQTTSCATRCPHFDGSTSYVSTANTLGTSGTLEAWINLDSIPDGSYRQGAEIFNTSTTYDQCQTHLYINTSGNLVLDNFNTGANHHLTLTGATSLSTKKWYHVAATWNTNGSNLTANLYVNGCSDASYGPSMSHIWDNSGSPTSLAIGGWSSSIQHYGSTHWALRGYIDEARSWSVDRTQCQIIDHMEQLDFFGSDHANLQCYYQFNESSLPTSPAQTQDSYNNSNYGTLNNIGTWVTSTAPVISYNSIYNTSSNSCPASFSGNTSSIKFNGSTNYVTTNSYNLGTSGTLEAWINLDSIPDGSYRQGAEIFNTSTSYDQDQTHLYINPSAHLVLDNYNSIGNHLTLTGTASFSVGKWYHVAATWNTSGSNLTANLYVNGCSDASYGPSTSHTWDNSGSPTSLAIGGWSSSIQHYGTTNWALRGYIDEVKVWDIARDQCDILSTMYISVPTSYPSDLKCYYKFNDNSGTSPSNSIGSGPTGSFSSNNPSWNTGSIAPIDPTCANNCRPVNTTGIKQELNDLDINIYPNPNNGIFIVETNAAAKQILQLYDISGKLILSQNINNKTTINVSNLNEGVYNIKILGNSSVVNKKIIILK